jgi:hypothetical protein
MLDEANGVTVVTRAMGDLEGGVFVRDSEAE